MLKVVVILFCVATWIMLMTMFMIIVCDIDMGKNWHNIFKGDGRDDKQ